MSFAGTTFGMISSNAYNLGFLRKTSAYQNNRKFIDASKIVEDGADNRNKPLSLEDLKDVHGERLNNAKFKIFFFGFIPWGILVMWWMGLIG